MLNAGGEILTTDFCFGSSLRWPPFGRSALNVECWMLNVECFRFAFASFAFFARPTQLKTNNLKLKTAPPSPLASSRSTPVAALPLVGLIQPIPDDLCELLRLERLGEKIHTFMQLKILADHLVAVTAHVDDFKLRCVL